MFHLLVCLRQTWTLFSSGCPASFRGLPVHISLSPARLLRVCPRDPGAAVPVGRYPWTERWVCPHLSVPAALESHREPPRRYPREEKGQSFLRGCKKYAAGPTVCSARRCAGVLWQDPPRDVGPSLWAHGMRPCWPPWARRGWLRVPDHLTPPDKSTETLRFPQALAHLNDFSPFQGASFCFF